MKYFSVSEALAYLNHLYPTTAPRNEETLRRAIRSGELKAEQRLGRGGNRINEIDLIEYSKKYQKKALVQNIKINANLQPVESFSTGLVPNSDFSLSQILKEHISEDGGDNLKLLKVQLLEARKKWANKRDLTLNKIQLLNNEVSYCNSEIKLIDEELSEINRSGG